VIDTARLGWISIPRVGSSNLSERAKPTFTELPPSSPVITTTSKKSPFDGLLCIAGGRAPSLTVARMFLPDYPLNYPSI
jgi:hypothetical protein